LKAQIIQDLIANKIELASERYQKLSKMLLGVSKREISWYVHQKLDKEIIFFYFEDIPEPFSTEEMASTNVQSLDDATKQEQEAKQRLEEAKKRPPNILAPSFLQGSDDMRKRSQLRETKRQLSQRSKNARISRLQEMKMSHGVSEATCC
jgi:hypothetical protein